MKNTVIVAATTVLAWLAGSALAQDGPVIDMFFLRDPSINSLPEGLDYVGSVINAGPSATTFQMDCAATETVAGCGTPAVVTQGPSTWRVVQSEPNLQATAECKITKTTEKAVCTATVALPVEALTMLNSQSLLDLVTGTATHQMTTSDFTATASSTDITQVPVTITAGAEKLSSASAAAATDNGAKGLGIGAAGVVAGAAGMVMMAL